jgi:hypothetical protein
MEYRSGCGEYLISAELTGVGFASCPAIVIGDFLARLTENLVIIACLENELKACIIVRELGVELFNCEFSTFHFTLQFSVLSLAGDILRRQGNGQVALHIPKLRQWGGNLRTNHIWLIPLWTLESQGQRVGGEVQGNYYCLWLNNCRSFYSYSFSACRMRSPRIHLSV